MLGDCARGTNHLFTCSAVAIYRNLFILVVFAEHGSGEHQLRFDVADVNDVMVTEALWSDVVVFASRAVELVTVRLLALPFRGVIFALVANFIWIGLLVQLDQLIYVEVVGDVI